LQKSTDMRLGRGKTLLQEAIYMSRYNPSVSKK